MTILYSEIDFTVTRAEALKNAKQLWCCYFVSADHPDMPMALLREFLDAQFVDIEYRRILRKALLQTYHGLSSSGKALLANSTNHILLEHDLVTTIKEIEEESK